MKVIRFRVSLLTRTEMGEKGKNLFAWVKQKTKMRRGWRQWKWWLYPRPPCSPRSWIAFLVHLLQYCTLSVLLSAVHIATFSPMHFVSHRPYHHRPFHHIQCLRGEEAQIGLNFQVWLPMLAWFYANTVWLQNSCNSSWNFTECIPKPTLLVPRSIQALYVLNLVFYVELAICSYFFFFQFFSMSPGATKIIFFRLYSWLFIYQKMRILGELVGLCMNCDVPATTWSKHEH